ncbi:MAG TPA: mechanosensitive ion channel domain-containing protein [Pyrinomonadaceae bacterium]|jgi:small-conductance mechanosensitive channel|nr:mechanosensitive ion channel domain-containing protein [Pyrinomonadaceae bacterium]
MMLTHTRLAFFETSTELLKRIWGYANHPFQFGNFSVSLSTLLQGVGVLLAAYLVSRYLRAFLTRRFAHSRRLDAGLQYTVLRLTHYLVVGVGVLFALRLGFGADLTSLAVVFTALSVGIGFGLQYIAGDIASGFILLFERPVRVGDFITVGVDSKTVEGRVRTINLRTTTVMTNDRIAVIVPNSKLVSDNLVNWSHPDTRSRISIPVGVASDADTELVTATLIRAAEGVEYVLAEPKPSVQLTAFGDFTLDFRLLVWTEHPRRNPKIKSDINFRINRLFKEAGIEIPNPQREVLLRGGSLRVDTRGGEDVQHRFDYGVEDREEDFSRR